MIYSVEEIINAISPIQIIGKPRGLSVSSYSIDSRQCAQDSLFFAFVGEFNDGHDYINHAVTNGAACIIAERSNPDTARIFLNAKSCLLIVNDALEAMHQLAKFARSNMTAKFICVTGSLGKTTTKEMIGDVLSKYFLVTVAEGNKNNHLGLPLTILNANPKSNIIVLEMGMNHSGEISKLTDLARPDIAVITTIAPAHVGNFDSVDQIADAKSEIFEGVDQAKGIVLLNQQNSYFPKLVENAKKSGIKNILGLGLIGKSPIYIDNYKVELGSSRYDLIVSSGENKEIINCSIPSVSYHAAYNTIFVYAISKLLKLDLNEVQKIVSKFKGVEGRGNMETIMCGKKKITIINDCYNASPESTKAAILTINSVKKENPNMRTVCVLGDMLELGKFSKYYHEELANVVIEYNIQKVFTVGNEMLYLSNKLPENIRGEHFENSESAKRKIKNLLENNDLVLFKASKSVKLNLIIENLYKY